MNKSYRLKINLSYAIIAQSVGAVEYTGCNSADGYDTTNECPDYGTKESDGEIPVKLELWGMRSSPLLPSLQGPFKPGMVASDMGPIYGLNRTNGILMLN